MLSVDFLMCGDIQQKGCEGVTLLSASAVVPEPSFGIFLLPTNNKEFHALQDAQV